MKKTENPETRAKTWKDIPQKGMGKTASAASRQRRWRIWMKTAAGFASLVLVGATVFYFYGSLKDTTGRIQLPETQPELDRITLHTDGVLDAGWLRGVLELGSEGLRNYHLADIRRRLEAQGQVRSAKVAVDLPDTLVVTLQERVPVVRARVERGVDLLVSRDGVVYEGHGYPAATLKSMPHLAGVRFRREGDGFAPVAGMVQTERLLRILRRQAPSFFDSVRLVSFERFNGDPKEPGAAITLRSSLLGEVRFSPLAMERQVARLIKVLEYALTHRYRGVKGIDLSLDERAVVQFVEPVSRFVP